MDSGDQSSAMGAPSPDPEEGVLPAVVRNRSDGTERYICYDAGRDPEDVSTRWLSVDADAPVSLVLWR
jgi:hypothetical protein